MGGAEEAGESAGQQSNVRVSTLELFFDLVFVFTITQVTQLIVAAHEWPDYFRALLVLTVTWWMYGGYAWLTNNLDLRKAAVRLLLLTGMAGFLVMALALPQAFGRDGLAFGLAYLVVVTLHAGLFSQVADASSARAIWGIAPYNLGAAGLVLAAGLVEAPWDWLLWSAAVVVVILSSILRRERGFRLSAGHFAERHGLVVLIVLGESLVAIGAGAADEPVDLTLATVAVLGLGLSAALWWSYFDRDDSQAEHALAAAEGSARAKRALYGYGYAHLLMIAGVVVMAAGLKQVLAHLDEPHYAAAIWHLEAGIGLYLLADALFRRILGIARGDIRWVVGLLALLSVPLGFTLGALAQLGLLLGLLIAMLVIEQGQHH